MSATTKKQSSSLSVFGDKSVCPSVLDLHRALSFSASLWDDLVNHVTHTFPPITEHWNFTSAKFGWSLRLKRREKIVLYLIPQSDYFLVGIVLGAKAVAAAQVADLPASVRKTIADAPRYAEGTGFRLPVANPDDLSAIEQLAALKLA